MRHDVPILSDHLKAFQEDIHARAKNHGWWDHPAGKHFSRDVFKPEKIALMHSELSEALEAVRCGKGADEHCPSYENEAVEFADVIIRILDYAEAFDLDVIGAMFDKHEFNRTRGYKHGGKAF